MYGRVSLQSVSLGIIIYFAIQIDIFTHYRMIIIIENILKLSQCFNRRILETVLMNNVPY